MKCPVCDNVNSTLECPKCGFDSSRDYGKHPTFGPLGKLQSVSALRQEWVRNQKEPAKERDLPPVPEPTLDPVDPPRKKPWLLIALAAIAAILALAVGISAGSGGGKPEPAAPKETVQMQEPPETTMPPSENAVLPETTMPPNTLRSDWIPESYFSNRSEYRVFGSDYRRQQIMSVTFLDTLADMPADAWDVSETGNGKVMAWVKPNQSAVQLFDLYIGAEGGVWAGTSCNELFANYNNLSKISFGDAFHTDNVHDMSQMFANCYGLASLDLRSFNTANVRDMSSMFYCCWNGLIRLDLSNFDTANVQYMSSMFFGCDQLTSLDLSSFDTANVTDMSQMFYSCDNLTSIKLGDSFVTDNADTTDMFTNCPAGVVYYQNLVN